MKRPISIALDDDMVRVLDFRAVVEERSRSQIVGRALKAWLHGNDITPRPPDATDPLPRTSSPADAA